MPQYYFGIETVSQGGKPDPEKDKIIAIHYQKIDFRSGKPLQKIEILKEWESSEEAIVTQFYNKFFRGGQNKWIFIPVGFDLNQAWEYIDTKFEEYLGSSFVNKRFHYTIPHIDLDSMVVLLNKGNFIGAKLEKFTKHPTGIRDVKQWYENQEYEKILSHINSSAESFLMFFTRIKENVHRVLEDAPPIPKAPLPSQAAEEPASIPAPEPEISSAPDIPTPPSQPPKEEQASKVPSEDPGEATAPSEQDEIPSEEPEIPGEEIPPPPEEVTSEDLPPEVSEVPDNIPEEVPPESPEPVETHEPEETPGVEAIHEPDEVPGAEEAHHSEEGHEIDVEHDGAEDHEHDPYHEAEEAHEVAEIHEEEVHEVTEIHHHDEHADFAPEAIAVEAVEEHDEHVEAVEVEAVEDHDVHAEAVEVEAVPRPPQRPLSPKELKKRLKEEAKQKKKEKKAKAKKK